MEETQSKNDIFIHQFQVARVPIIEEQLQMNNRNPWINYGIANLAPQELIRLYSSAPTHRACITSKHYGVRGESISLKDGDNGRLLMANQLGEDLYSIWDRCILDFLNYGAFSLNIVWKNDRSQGFEIYYMDASKIRAEKMDMNDHINNYYYSGDWVYPKKYIPRKIPAFNPTEELPSQIFYYKTHVPSYDYYSQPSWWASATAVATETEIYNWWHSNIINGLNPSLFVSLNSGIPAPEERQQIYESMSSKFGSSNNPGKLFLTFADSKDQAPEVTTIQPNSSDKMYIEMNQAVQQAILTAHQISSPELLGIQTSGKLGTPDHLEAQDHFFNLVIKPIQQEVKRCFERLLNLRDGKPADIVVEQFKMVELPDTRPIAETVKDTTKNPVTIPAINETPEAQKI
jgi:hypothetical protein